MIESERLTGSALLGSCPRTGWVELFTKEGRSVILPTRCKTWGCVICRRTLVSLFRARVEHGVSTLGRCCFITLTYQRDTPAPRSVASVRAEYTALWRRLHRRFPQWQWLKVTELTTAGIPHHHLIVGPIEGRRRCHGYRIRKGRDTAIYRGRIGLCDCLAHVFAEQWLAVTGDSYMCFQVEVNDAQGAGGYLAKYLIKQWLGKRWPGRRFTTSRGWPGGGRLQLARTLSQGWDHIRMWPSSKFDSTLELNPNEADLLERTGTDLMIGIRRRLSRKAAKKQFEGVLGHDLT